ncbi:hypothetical protein [Algoriphagus pacificus]|uniref:Uncharacterized protein n=1 Tax=Algoriphagus pacificus TaxID=2811234 RepID=A0ABS3CL44_9BACT|nr:hypothetical protein [Algoriphagus pacificus]MBN7816354.1 hypothetical protein [Algoriphagus pacificus]
MDKINLQLKSVLGKGHYFFGFHDLIAFSHDNEKILCLNPMVINRPPLPGEKIDFGFANTFSGNFISIGKTNAFNFPQGARQQWLDNEHFIINNQIGDKWGAQIYDTISGNQVESYQSSIHCLSKNKKLAFGLDYQRIHRLGGYGYIGINDECYNDPSPSTQGLWILDLHSKERKLLVSIKEVAECDIFSSSKDVSHHFITHPVLNPSNNRIAFLHRFFLPDGGIRTRLMSIGIEGNNLRCLAVGFLSHFDWKDDQTIFIWGRTGGNVDNIRSNPIFSNPLVKPLLGVAKNFLKNILYKVSNQLSMSFLLVRDNDIPNIKEIAKGILTEDGHPMFSPINRDLIINDTYPNSNGERILMLFDFYSNVRRDLGVFKMINEKPYIADYYQVTKGVDQNILNMISYELYCFTRSGLHCDLHPRWNANGTSIAFDSIHEGKRNLYWTNIENLIS